MHLSPQALEELKRIHKKIYGEKLSDQEAQEIGMNLLNLFSAIYRPIPKKFLEKSKEIEDKVDKKTSGQLSLF